MKYIIINDERFDWISSLLFGFLISATDPVATIAILKELGVSKRLSILIEGESLLNDGTAMVGFLVVLVRISVLNTSRTSLFSQYPHQLEMSSYSS